MKKILSILVVIFVSLSCTLVHADTPKTWTFLVYLNGNNSLDTFGEKNILSMESIGSNDQVNVIVQWASLSKHKAVRMLIKKSSNPNVVTSPIVQDLGNVDMGNVQTLQDFIQWGVQNYPAEHYFIDVWNHGSGWHALKRGAGKQAFHPLDISWDDNTDHAITTRQLGQAMTYAAHIIGHKVDLYGSDACLMAMAEVANEMIDSVDFYVGSQELEPGDGWPYADLLSRWEATPNASADQVAKILVDAYVKSYEGGNNGTEDATFSAYDLSRLAAFDVAIGNLSANIRALNSIEKQKIVSILPTLQRFNNDARDYADLLDFTKKLSLLKLNGMNVNSIEQVKAAANQLIIANQDTANYKNATGLSIWLPAQRGTYFQHARSYQALAFNAATRWSDTLNALFKSTA